VAENGEEVEAVDIVSVVIGMVLAALAVVFIARPLVHPEHFRSAPEEDLAVCLQADLEREFRLLEEMQMEHETGKLGAEEYAAEQHLLLRRAAALMRQIDEAQGAGAGGQSG